ncbi:MAG: putative calcium-binding acidic-repeat protein [Candidatus Uhrbacteria bacterium GW2011_GWE2_45_35]|uniref:Putative calcium-binding acidic-repeat protein n=2 Tax=Candidatus Uhriibacteriota TaxID=1752732 RepID=A0A0G1MFY7_9BACT|nr:MAG: putative calcium-binding acidic-repeat protein [Candidatus Uhrbacteria bacterium GW2011_GWF2_44_350]KKU09132.1 MAG: putative calcium-binding acidic-repeat protein [Candidatus Uhrbacteria bacterium GW2011_GWE2_45_35]HBR80554.1 hypothetical protein [Candidatus Uhrbacteria bacterium]HCU31459.1 hypothetical protein [Candidatus Uhrbacteria bacterium]
MNGFEYQVPPIRRTIPWKLVVIIGGSLVLVVLIILGARWFIGSRSVDLQRTANIDRISQELDTALQTCDNEKCRVNKVEDIAQKFGAAELCQKLDDNSLTSCAWKVAKEKADPQSCEIISDQEKQVDCQDSVYRLLATQDLDLSWCEKIQNEIVRARCVNSLSENIARTKGCSGTGVDQSVCDRLNNLEAAMASADPDQCMTLSEPGDQDNCLEGMSLIDADRDGLSATLEAELGTSDNDWDFDADGLSDLVEYRTYGTDPTNPDSDGDGYSDGTEVNGGYNPLGSGPL